MSALRLTGYGFSVYTRAVRIALAEKGLAHACDEVDPFDPAGRDALAGLHPFGRVPVLRHGAFRLYETAAILGYLDDAFGPPLLSPDGAQARARVAQVIGIADAYAYCPLVRQAFAHAVFRPRLGEPSDARQVAEGLAAAGPVLDALEEIAAEGRVLTGRTITRADCHLAPMLDYFAHVPEGRVMLDARPALSRWLSAVVARPAFAGTRPQLPRSEETVP